MKLLTVLTSQVIVELGTGYFCEKEVPDAKDLIDRKVIHIIFLILMD